ncbi:L-seryl-tRNA(Sec) selenium transferase [Salsuginibacillus halophilus]|uniref:L-seryl-tRNA(Sec) selenium transferase n=1 Tax=Salsuginibacillus halophilus TaxID=517424 RepID=A0A2P8HYP7_9BACI|nr:L-seryl-tRNA(Sec) selenium transferase [Salsuginibacillus halophilus]PSL51323.1 L-seryl-tRNA(Sec) selenium transferase [Salsuginibacillus halophilus]
MHNEWFRALPSIDEVQKHENYEVLKSEGLDEVRLTNWLREEVERMRNHIRTGKFSVQPEKQALIDDILHRLTARVLTWQKPRLEQVINATGTVLHTNLGRARLSDEAAEAAKEAGRRYSTIEYNKETGERGSRQKVVEDRLTTLTGAESAMVVNNNAAAVYFVLQAFASGRKVIVSRGELVEIGGSFRVSSIMEESGAQLVEVGTTNKTHLYDYERALNEETAMVMKVHTSNFYMQGFTQSVSSETIQEMNGREDILLFEDLGSGVMYDFSKEHIGQEPTVQQAVKSGADLITFSGDKLLGGPQAGIIAGKKSLIDQLKKHQLARVLRVDKMTFAALDETLKAYISEETAKALPAVRDVIEPADVVYERALLLADKLQAKHYKTEVYPVKSQVGGGTMPEVELNSFGVCVAKESVTAAELERTIRLQSDPAVIARIQDGWVCLDLRTIALDEIEDAAAAFP